MSRRPASSLLIALVIALLVPAGAQARSAGSKAPTHVDTPGEISVDLATQVRTARLAGVRAFTVSASQQFLPTTWCGTERTTDDLADAAQLSDEAVYKIVYAYASDQPDRFDTWKNQLQANVSLIGQFMAQQDGATKAPRFDMGTSCGPTYADIQTVALPNPRAYYADQSTQFDRIKAAVAVALGATPVKRNVVILADGLGTNPGGFYGLGEHYNGSAGEVSGASNIHNSGNLYATLFPPLDYSPPTASGQQFYPGFWPEGMLHEMTHTLGAVNALAPNATSRGHCTDGMDVMCYADGGTSAAPYSTSACGAIAGSAGMTQTYDCGRNDYFSTSPAPGSYLATHWNIYDSVFESPCATIGFACGADGTAPPAGVSAPRVTGTRKVTNTLTADHGSWSGTPTAYAYQWQRIAGANPPADIPGAIAAAYTLVPDDAGAQVQVIVTATNANGSATGTSGASAIPAFNPPVNASPPSISGTPQRTRTLTASNGTWSNAPGAYGYQWQRDEGGGFADIAAATAQAYVLGPDDLGTTVRVLVTASNVDGDSSPAATNPVGPVIDMQPPVNTTPPSVLGSAQSGRTLTATNGAWDNAPASFARQWQRATGGVFSDIADATGASYLLGAADVGHPVRVVVVAGNAEGDSEPVPSSATGAVAAPALAPAVIPPADVFRSVKVSLKNGRRITLKLTVTSRTTLSGLVATVPSKRVKVIRRGTYRLTLCAGPVCITKPFKARHGKAKLPAIVAASRIIGPVTLKLIGPGGRATGALS